jgi:hypothetical protein
MLLALHAASNKCDPVLTPWRTATQYVTLTSVSQTGIRLQ